MSTAVAWDGSQVRLIVNSGFFSSLASDEGRVAILKHKLLHVAFQHLSRQAGRNPQMENIAADLVVNQLISPWLLPATAVTLGSFPDLGLEADRSLEYYDERLTRLRGTPAAAVPMSHHPSSASRVELAPAGQNR